MNGVQHALEIDNLGRARELLYRHRPKPADVDLRGWEWRYLWQLSQSDAQSVLREANENSVLSLAASADGNASGDWKHRAQGHHRRIRVSHLLVELECKTS